MKVTTMVQQQELLSAIESARTPSIPKAFCNASVIGTIKELWDDFCHRQALNQISDQHLLVRRINVEDDIAWSQGVRKFYLGSLFLIALGYPIPGSIGAVIALVEFGVQATLDN